LHNRLAVAVFLLLAAGCRKSGEKTMMAPNESDSVEAAAPAAEVPGIQIRSASSASTPVRAQPAPKGESTRPYINDQLNSRLPKDLADGPLAVRWKADLAPEFPSAFVLAAGNRIVTEAPGRWQLFDAEGKALGAGKLGAGDVVMDASNGLLYTIDPYGVIEAYRLSDGALAYSVSISGGEEWQRAFYARRGNEFAIVSFSRLLQPHAAATPSGVSVDVQDLGNPIDVQQEIVASARQKSRLYFESPRASAALLGDSLITAIRNEIVVTAFGESVRRRLLDKFEAGPLSLDESGRIYILVSQATPQPSLWVLTQEGERVAAFAPPADFTLTATPPVVGYDHQIYLASRHEIIMLSAQGALLWRRPSQGAIAGIAVTPAGSLIVAEGSSLSAFDSKGERQVLYKFEGESLSTPPAMTPSGDIVVASTKRLYCLAGAARPR
jgi:hypothetical protein